MDILDPPPDIITHLLVTCSPELVEYIFAFTTRDHASAAGFFDLAVRLPLFAERKPHPYLPPVSPIEHALQTGDLPLFRHLLTTPHRHCNWYFLGAEGELWPVDPRNHARNHVRNLHVYMYAFTLIDVSSPLLSDTDACNELKDLFDKLRRWAMSSLRIDVLEWLQRSRFAHKTQPAFVDWGALAVYKRLPLVQHMYDRHLFNEMSDDPDRLLRLALKSNWPDALTHLHAARGVRFRTWTAADVAGIVRNEAAATALRDHAVLPDDACLQCRDTWLPRIGWWGLVGVYASHATGFHAPADDAIARRAVAEMHARSPQYLRNALNAAAERRDVCVLDHLARGFPEMQPTARVVISVVRRNDPDTLRFLVERYPRVVAGIVFRRVQVALRGYYESVLANPEAEFRSVVEVVRILDAATRMRNQATLEMGSKLVLLIIRARDAEFLAWAMGQGRGRWRFRTRDLQRGRDEAAAKVDGDGEMCELVKMLDAHLRRDEETGLSEEQQCMVELWSMIEE